MARFPKDDSIKGSSGSPSGKPKWRRGVGNRTTMSGDVAAAMRRKQRRIQAFNMKAMGASYARIGEELGVSARQAKIDVRKACAEHGSEDVAQKRVLLTRGLEEAMLVEHQAVLALRPFALGERAADGTWKRPPDIEASRALATHNRTLARIYSELGILNGARVPVVSKVEHTGAGGGPIELSLDDVLRAVDAGRENEANAARDAAGENGPH